MRGKVGYPSIWLWISANGPLKVRSPRIGAESADIGPYLFHFTKHREQMIGYRDSEAESAPIRSAVKFPFTIDIRIFFQLFQKNIFRST